MESIKEFFKHINYRLSSPLIFSFIISWFIFNWPIIIGLVFYDKELLKIDGFNSYISLIAKNLNWQDSFKRPLIAAVIYTVANPLFSAVIQAFYVWVQKWSDKWHLNILGGGKIGVDKYLKLREDLDKKRLLLEEVIEKESTSVVELNRKETKIIELENTLNKAQSIINEKQAEVNRLLGKHLFLNKYAPSGGLHFEQHLSFTEEDFKKLWKPAGTKGAMRVYSGWDHPVEKYINTITENTEDIREKPFDYIIGESPVKIIKGICEIILRPVEDNNRKNKDYAFYMRLEMKNRDENEGFWFNITPERREPFKQSARNGKEYIIGTESKALVEDRPWFCMQFDISKTFQQTFFHDQLQLERVSGFRIRGDLCLARIRIYDSIESPLLKP